MSKVSKTLLKKIFTKTKTQLLDRFVEPFNTILPKYGINNKKEFAAFIANVGIESDRLKTTKEYGGVNYFKRYEGRTDLGNVREGDGIKYPGRSILQTTGRFNYWRVVVAYLKVLTGKDWGKWKNGKEILIRDFDNYLKSPEYDALLKEADKYNVNFLAHPELLEQFPHAVEAAGVFVKDNNLNKYANAGKFYAYAGVLNRGSATKKALHYSERLALYELAMKVIPDDLDLTEDSIESSTTDLSTDTTLEVVEIEQKETLATPEGETTQTLTGKNEQDVTKPALVTEPPSQNLGSKLKAGIGTLFGGTLIYTVAEKFAGFSFTTQSVIIICFIILLSFLGFVVWAALDAWKQAQRTKVEAEAKTDIYRKDIKWVKPE